MEGSQWQAQKINNYSFPMSHHLWCFWGNYLDNEDAILRTNINVAYWWHWLNITSNMDWLNSALYDETEHKYLPSEVVIFLTAALWQARSSNDLRSLGENPSVFLVKKLKWTKSELSLNCYLACNKRLWRWISLPWLHGFHSNLKNIFFNRS